MTKQTTRERTFYKGYSDSDIFIVFMMKLFTKGLLERYVLGKVSLTPTS